MSKILRHLIKLYKLCVLPPKGKALVFLHIPKTAGSSFKHSIGDVFVDVRNILHPRVLMINPHATFQLSEITGRELMAEREAILLYVMSSSYSYIAGHHGFSPLAYKNFSKDYVFFTILREPVERFLSEYFYNISKSSLHFHLDLDLDAYLNTKQAEDSATTYLRYLGAPASGYTDNPEFSVKSAIDNLRKIDILGTMEDIPAVVRKLEGYLGRKLYLEHLNKNPSKDYKNKITQEQVNKIRQMCASDIEIYNAALDILK